MRQRARHYVQLAVASDRFKRTFLVCCVAAILFSLVSFVSPYRPQSASTQSLYSEVEKPRKSEYVRAEVLSISKEGVVVKPMEGRDAGQQKTIAHNYIADSASAGDTVLINYVPTDDNRVELYAAWRVPGILILAVVFLAFVAIIGRKRGVYGVVGLLVGVAIIAFGIVPLIIAGYDAFWVTVLGAFLIAFASVYIAHGFHLRTTISIAAIAIVMVAIVLLSLLAADITTLTGVYDEATSLYALNNSKVDLGGVLIGGIIIATLGVLDDIVTTQVAAVDQLYRTDRKLSVAQLYHRASDVGREHIAALVNTLALAYIGVSLPTVLALVTLSQSGYADPLMIINMEYIAQEIVRTLVSSTGLVLAVPVSTLLAAYWIKRNGSSPKVAQVAQK